MILFLFLPFVFYGQEEQESFYYTWFDQIIGQEHTGLYNGKQYLDLDINKIYKNKHAFFLSDKVLNGSVKYNGQDYYNLGMKYNLETGHLMISLKSGALSSIIQLVDNKINEFVIEGHRFINIKHSNKNEDVNRFCEVLLENANFVLLKQHKKERKMKTDNLEKNNAFYEFVSSNDYVLYIEGNYEIINSKNQIINIYPNLKKDIKQFYVTNKALRKSEHDAFMKKLFDQVIKSSLSQIKS